jgi:hypothetical protein
VWSGYLEAGAFLLNLLQAANDPRLSQYFALNAEGQYVGADPGETVDPSAISPLSAERLAPDFRQPFVTWAENQLIIAEAAYQTGNAGLALASLEAVRADAGLSPITPAPTGAALLDAILTEKYIRTFQSPEAWNDYRRTCFPLLKPAPGASAIPARILYPLSERNANPNVPPPSGQPLRNWNDPTPCP